MVFSSIKKDLVMKIVMEEIPLPPGTKLKEILSVEFPHEDVGNAFQFL